MYENIESVLEEGSYFLRFNYCEDKIRKKKCIDTIWLNLMYLDIEYLYYNKYNLSK